MLHSFKEHLVSGVWLRRGLIRAQLKRQLGIMRRYFNYAQIVHFTQWTFVTFFSG